MSWTMQAKIPKGATRADAVAALCEAEVRGNEDCPVEREHAVNEVCDLVTDLIMGGAVGRVDKTGFAVNVYGHCNPGNAPREGYANDRVQIEIEQTE